jgi:hypothetical protein
MQCNHGFNCRHCILTLIIAFRHAHKNPGIHWRKALCVVVITLFVVPFHINSYAASCSLGRNRLAYVCGIKENEYKERLKFYLPLLDDARLLLSCSPGAGATFLNERSKAHEMGHLRNCSSFASLSAKADTALLGELELKVRLRYCSPMRAEFCFEARGSGVLRAMMLTNWGSGKVENIFRL